MKTKPLALFIALALFLMSCTKEKEVVGPAGPAGPTGPAGTAENGNFVTAVYKVVDTLWTTSDEQRYYYELKNVAALTDTIVKRGGVIIAVGTGTADTQPIEYQNVPWEIEYGGHLDFSYTKNNIVLDWNSNNEAWKGRHPTFNYIKVTIVSGK